VYIELVLIQGVRRLKGKFL